MIHLHSWLRGWESFVRAAERKTLEVYGTRGKEESYSIERIDLVVRVTSAIRWFVSGNNTDDDMKRVATARYEDIVVAKGLSILDSAR